MQNKRAPAYPISSVDNALRLLLMFRETRSVRVTDVAAALGVAGSTAHRLLATLQRHGFVEQDGETRAYHAGAALAEIGLASVREDGLRAQLRPHVERLRDELNETIQLVVAQGANCLFIDTAESHRPLRTASRVGITVPAHCLSGGKALLAELPRERLRRLFPDERIPGATPRSITSRAALEADLEEVRARGYATNFGESEPEIGSIGVAVRDADGRPRAGLAVSGPLTRVNDRADLTEILRAMRATAGEAGAGLA